MSDLIGWIMLRACDRFGGNDGTFNAAGFSCAWRDVTGLPTIDGRAVRAMLHGRNDVVLLDGGAHYRIATR